MDVILNVTSGWSLDLSDVVDECPAEDMTTQDRTDRSSVCLTALFFVG